ncbi:hypothetical protein DEO72_LG10g1887 [Vigna unguiculata]|uniref:Uncharacterized protein n=1 Tax=Vigna unguiculata TaxID=3917 RepID=A0A4D6NA94_VIGUN|nr:hypothetical protein DEO72_LG10g1887 [Vigna unguiculata]
MLQFSSPKQPPSFFGDEILVLFPHKLLKQSEETFKRIWSGGGRRKLVKRKELVLTLEDLSLPDSNS